MKPDPFVKYITKEIVEALEGRLHHPKEKKKSFRANNFWLRWFGMIPFSLKIYWEKKKSYKN